MPLEVRRELKLGDITVVIEPEKYPEDEFLAYIAFGQDDNPDGSDYVLPLQPEQWQTLKDLIDETFRHMQTYLDRLPKEEEDEEE
ncbi:MAG: hypothetical protein R6W94_04560 [Spirochaetia bacterium]